MTPRFILNTFVLKPAICIIFILLLLISKSQNYYIKNVTIVDGSGSNKYVANVRIQNGIIDKIGQFKPQPKDSIINATGLYVAPGFIDAHSHHLGVMKQNPLNVSATNQGITTIVIGQDGSSYPMDTLINLMHLKQLTVNVASFTGHSSLRETVLGSQNLHVPATDSQINAMKELLNTDLKNGSLGLSTGLEYEAAFYAPTSEVIALTKLLKPHNGLYISHIRSEDIQEPDAIKEIIDIAKQTQVPVQISHIKIADKNNWRTAKKILATLDSANNTGLKITADIYPYTYWNSTLRVLFPDKQFKSLKSAQLATERLFEPDSSYLVRFEPRLDYEGKTISNIASLRHETPAQTLLYLVDTAEIFERNNPLYQGSIEAIAGKSMCEEDIIDFLQWQHTVICSDGNGGGHPRGYGAFTRVLHKYVVQNKILSIENAIRKMTGQTADYFSLPNMGYIKNGYAADLVLFNLQEVQDNAIINNSKALSDGIEIVWVNGKIVYKNKTAIPNFSGKFIKRSQSNSK